PLLAGVQPCRQLHRRRRRDPAGRARRGRSQPATARCRRRGRTFLIKVRVPETAAGLRLDRFLASLPEIGSRAAAERLLAEGAVLVEGAVREKSHRLEGGEEVELEQARASEPVAAEPIDLRVVYEDEHLLVVDKPAGLVVHPGSGHAGGTLAHALAGRTAGGPAERQGIVHRLDRETSGLMVVARTEDAYRGLARLVRRRELERFYLALVRGTPRSY